MCNSSLASRSQSLGAWPVSRRLPVLANATSIEAASVLEHIAKECQPSWEDLTACLFDVAGLKHGPEDFSKTSKTRLLNVEARSQKIPGAM
jgi:hypothetical protein